MESFFLRSYRTIGVVGLLLALGLWAHWGWEAAAAFLVGVLIGALMFAGTIIAVRGMSRPPETRPRQWPRVVAHIGKFALAAALIYCVARWEPNRLPLVAAGYLVPITVVLLRSAGRDLNRRLGIDDRDRQA
jgi:MFS family permease